ncbi:MAG: carbohydrate ABC transporter substrate-binding protein [Clostridia bacterium]|nr:carbohydrate ABC transporter substrate-binding protein [Clostridia bacterium]
MKIKKRVAILTIALFAAFFAFGCAPRQGKTKLYIGYWPEGTNEQKITLYEKWENNFESAYPQYDIIASPYTYNPNTVTAKYVSGQLPTVFLMDFNYAQTAFNNGYIKDVSQIFNEKGWKNEVASDVLTQISNGENVFGIPCEQYGAGMAVNLNMLSSADIIKKDFKGNYALYDGSGNALYPNTFAKIEESAGKILERYGADVSALFIPTATEECGRLFCNVLYNFGCDNLIVKEGNSWRADFNVEKMSNALRWIKTMSQQNYVNHTVSYGTNDWIQLLADEKCAMAICYGNTLSLAVSSYKNLKGNLAFFPLPTETGKNSYTLWGGTVYAISGKATEEQVEGVVKFLEYTGKTPYLTESAITAIYEERAAEFEGGTALLPPISAWNNQNYTNVLTDAFYACEPLNDDYFKEYFNGYATAKRGEEPHCRKELYQTLNELQKSVTFSPTRYDVVELIENAESEFTKQYLLKS